MKVVLCGNPYQPLCGFLATGLIAVEPLSVPAIAVMDETHPIPVRKKVKYLLSIDLTENEEKILVALNRRYANKQAHVYEPETSIIFGFKYKSEAEDKVSSFSYVLQDLFNLKLKSSIKSIGFLEENHFHNNSKVA